MASQWRSSVEPTDASTDASTVLAAVDQPDAADATTTTIPATDATTATDAVSATNATTTTIPAADATTTVPTTNAATADVPAADATTTDAALAQHEPLAISRFLEPDARRRHDGNGQSLRRASGDP